MTFVTEYTPLLTDAEIKSASPIAANVSTEVLRPFVRTSQTGYILPILGSALYSALITSYSGGTMTSDESYLRDLIKASLANHIAYEALPFIWNHISNKGVNQKSTEGGTAVDSFAYTKTRDSLLNLAEVSAKMLKDYLEADTLLASPVHPLYRSADSISDSGIWFSGIQFD